MVLKFRPTALLGLAESGSLLKTGVQTISSFGPSRRIRVRYPQAPACPGTLFTLARTSTSIEHRVGRASKARCQVFKIVTACSRPASPARTGATERKSTMNAKYLAGLYRRLICVPLRGGSPTLHFPHRHAPELLQVCP